MSNPRLTRVVATAALAVLALSACGGSEPTASPSAPLPSSATLAPTASASPTVSPTPTGPRTPAQVSTSLDAITVTGEKGQPPTVTFTAPWAIDTTRTKVLVEGDGTTVGETATVEVLYHGVNGATGQLFDENFTKGQATGFPLDQVVPGFRKGLAGQKVGSRVLIAMPGADGYDASGGQPGSGIQVGDTLIFVVDIIGASLTEPVGEPQKQDPADPQVGGDAKQPTLTVPAGYTPPSETVSKVIIAGHGTPVAAGDTVLVHYQTVSLRTGQVIEQSYGKQPEEAMLARMIPGWQKGLEGKNIGSRVLLVVPAKDAYGSQGNATPSIAPDDTLLFVVDLLYIPKI